MKKESYIFLGYNDVSQAEDTLNEYGISKNDAYFLVNKNNELNSLGEFNTILLDTLSKPRILKMVMGSKKTFLNKRNDHLEWKYELFINTIKVLKGKALIINESEVRQNTNWSLSFLLESLISLPLVVLGIILTLVGRVFLQVKFIVFLFKNLIYFNEGEFDLLTKRIASKMHDIEHRLLTGTRKEKGYFIVTYSLLAMFHLFVVLFFLPLFLIKRFSKSFSYKNVLLVSHESQINGAPRCLLTFEANIDKNEFDVVLVTPSLGLLTEAIEGGSKCFIIPVSQSFMQNSSLKLTVLHLLRLFIVLPYCMQLVIGKKIKTVHTNVFVTPDFAIVSKLLSLNHIWHYREFIDSNRKTRLQLKVMNRLSNKILCNSHYTRNFLLDHDLPENKVVVLHDAFDFSLRDKFNVREEYRKKFGVKDNDIFIGCAGQITSHKGQDIFVKAALKVLDSGITNVKFIIIGTLANKVFIDELKQMIEEKKQESFFIFTGFRNDIYNIFSSLDVHVTPSRWEEPFGMVNLEALALNAIAIGSNRGGIPYVLNQNKELIFDIENEDELPNKLINIVTDKIRYEKAKEECYDWAKVEFDIVKHIDSLQYYYRFNATRLARKALRGKRFYEKFVPGRVISSFKALIAYSIMVPLWFATVFPFTMAILTLLPVTMFMGFLSRKLTKGEMKVAVMAFQTLRNASTRYRVTKIFNNKAFEGAQVKIFYPSSDKAADIVYNSIFYGFSPYLRDFYYYFIVFPLRIFNIQKTYFYDVAVIQYELFHEGPMWFELLILKTHPKTVYDFDDALFVHLRFAKYLPKIIKNASMIVAGNQFLYDYCKEFNRNIKIIPTCPTLPSSVSTVRKESEPAFLKNYICIGWAGNPVSLSNLPEVRNALVRLQKRHKIVFMIVSAGPYKLEGLGLSEINIYRKEWSLAHEEDDIQMFEIGIMPVTDDTMGRGKCGFKGLQYMSLGVPCILSPVGVNSEIIEHGKNGFIATTEDEWYEAMEQLILDENLRQSFVSEGKKTIEDKYSLDFHAEKWKESLTELCALPESIK